MATTRIKLGGSKKGATVGKSAKRVKRPKSEVERFAVHLDALLKERGWTSQQLADACQAAKLPIKDHAIRAWLRGENMPKPQYLRPLGRVLGLRDPRHILPADE